MKRIIAVIFTAYMYIIFSIPALAMPQEAQSIPVKLSNYSNDCKYVDLLFEAENYGANYIDSNTENIKELPFDTAELAKYSDEGFVSFSCHFKDVKTNVELKDGKVTVAGHESARKLISENTWLKVAVLDKNGYILKVSEPILINSKNEFLPDGSYIVYDLDNDKVSADLYKDSDYSGIYKFFIITLTVAVALMIFLCVHSVANSLRKNRSEQNDKDKDETAGSFFKSVLFISALFIIIGLIQGNMLSDYSIVSNRGTEETILHYCAVLIPLIVSAVAAVRIKDFLKFVIPDFAYIFVLAQFVGGSILLLIDIFMFIIIQIIAMFLAVTVKHFSRDHKRGDNNG